MLDPTQPPLLPTRVVSNPPPFRATGKGWYNRLPNFPATVKNRTGVFVQGGVNDSSLWKRAHLFVTDVTTGWTLTGDLGQSKIGRTFYPKNLHQEAMTIQGIVANQYEYDLLTEFITHHQTQVATNVDHVITFKLFPYAVLMNPVPGSRTPSNPNGVPPAIPRYRFVSHGIKIEGVITSFQAGHERFVNAPTWSANFLITKDFLSSDPTTDIALDAIIKGQYEKIFGTPFTPGKKTANGQQGTPEPVQETVTQVGSGVTSSTGSLFDFFGNLI